MIKKQKVFPVGAKKPSVVAKNNGKVSASSTMAADTADLLKLHNQKMHKANTKSTYEPPRHSVRDIRQWERESQKVWADLNPQEKEVVSLIFSLFQFLSLLSLCSISLPLSLMRTHTHTHTHTRTGK
jgi:hypothetical protein